MSKFPMERPIAENIDNLEESITAIESALSRYPERYRSSLGEWKLESPYDSDVTESIYQVFLPFEGGLFGDIYKKAMSRVNDRDCMERSEYFKCLHVYKNSLDSVMKQLLESLTIPRKEDTILDEKSIEEKIKKVRYTDPFGFVKRRLFGFNRYIQDTWGKKYGVEVFYNFVDSLESLMEKADNGINHGRDDIAKCYTDVVESSYDRIIETLTSHMFTLDFEAIRREIDSVDNDLD